MSRKVRLASIGIGMIGQVHARALANLDCCEYVAIADMDPGRKKLADSLNVKYYLDFKDMIAGENLDGVVISVPNEKHAETGSYCADHGLHVFMEKPIASCVSDAEKLIESTKRNDVQLLIGHHRRFNPLINATKGILAKKELGNILGINMLWAMYKPSDYFQNSGDWRRRKGGGPILINIIHEIDNLRYLYGEIERVYAEVNNKARNFEVEDTIGVTLRMKGGAIATILLSDTVPSKWAYEQTMGENGFFFPGNGNIYHFLGDKGSLAFPEMLKISYEDKNRAGWQYPLKMERLNLKSADPYPAQMEHFCKVVQGMESPRTSGEDALQSLKVTMAIRDSGSAHRSIDV